MLWYTIRAVRENLKRKQKYLGVAQLGARYLGVVEAAGSSPVTQINRESLWFPVFYCLFTQEVDMFDIESYIRRFTQLLQQAFGERLVYVGLQGSYLRGEATDNSDIDIMAVIDGLSAADLDSYRSAMLSLENADKSCGFICSTADLAAWNPMEICHVLHSTKDYYGTLRELIPAYTEEDIRNFVKMSLGNLYHEICHRYIHASAERNAEALPYTYKGVFFILQNLVYLTQGRFAATKAELLPLLAGKDRDVLELSMALGRGDEYDFADSFALLFTWCQETLQKV